MFHHAFFNGTGVVLLLYDDDYRPTGLDQNFLILGQRAFRNTAEQRLRFTIVGQMLGQRQLTDIGNFPNITLGGPRCQILCIVDFKEFANLVEQRGARPVFCHMPRPDFMVFAVHGFGRCAHYHSKWPMALDTM